MTGGAPDDVLKDIRRYVENHPDAEPMTVLAQLGLPPAYRETVEDIVDDLQGAGPAEPREIEPDEQARDDDLAGVGGGSEFEDDSDDPHAAAGSWFDVDFSATEPDTYPAELLEREQWMGRAGESGKQPFAPWADRDHPDADADEDARWKWGIEDNYVDGDTIEIAEDDPRLDGRVFIQREDGPHGFIDGDDVRCPETGDIHPVFVAILEHLGLTYADVSDSEAGAHAWYQGELPIEGKGQAAFDIDTEPWGANDSPPSVEIYANKHVNVATGDHVIGTPLEVNEWDHDALRAILQANGYQDQDDPEISHDTDRDRTDLEEYDATATDADETATDVRDILTAVDRLGPRDLPLSSSRTGTDSTGWETWNPSYRSSQSGESVHRPPGESVFHDHKEGESFGVLGLFAAEQEIISNPWDRLKGAEWWTAVDTAREKGAPIPKYDAPDDAHGHDPVTVVPNPPNAPVALAYGKPRIDQRRENLPCLVNRYDRVVVVQIVSLF